MPPPLADRIALVTGASRGIGYASALALAKAGAHIIALARTVGWIAQWNEMIADPEQKIGRPRQLYVGSPRRDVKPIAQR